jgi:DHA3 family tetracycline resistance protein-like MFS transporter
MSLPYALLALPGGIASDRVDRRRVMIGADLIRACALLLLGALSIAGRSQLWHFVVLAAVFGAGSAFFSPAFDATIPELVPDETLPQANSLDQFVRPLALRLAGPMLGGVLVATIGAGWAFTVDAATFAVSVACVSRMAAVARVHGRPEGSSIVTDVLECYRFVRTHAWLWVTLVSSCIACLLFLGPSEVLLPYLVRHDLHADAGTLGAVLAFGGLGAISAAVILGRRGLPRHSITFMYAAWTASTLAVAAYGIATLPWHLMLACFAFNLLESAGLIIWATTKQRHVPRDMLGRVSSLDWLVATGLTPLSFALVGPAAALFGARATLVACGVLASFVTGGALFVPGVRLPDVADDDAEESRSEKLFTLTG